MIANKIDKMLMIEDHHELLMKKIKNVENLLFIAIESWLNFFVNFLNHKLFVIHEFHAQNYLTKNMLSYVDWNSESERYLSSRQLHRQWLRVSYYIRSSCRHLSELSNLYVWNIVTTKNAMLKIANSAQIDKIELFSTKISLRY